MIDRTRTCYPCELNQGLHLKLHAYSVWQKETRVQQDTPEKGKRLHQPKRCENYTQDENKSPKNPKK